MACAGWNRTTGRARVAMLVLSALAAMACEAAAQGPIDEALRHTVKIGVTIRHPFGFDHKGAATGSGFLVDRARGWIATNAHVAGRSPSRLRVNFRNGDSIEARKVHVDAHVDLAILAIPVDAIPAAASEARLRCAGDAVPGTAAIAFGHPWGLDFTATRGIVSSVRSLRGVEVLQTDAALNGGNSGGPLLDEASGQVIGVSAAAVGRRGASAEGLNLAVPVRHLCTILGLLRDGADPAPPRLPVAFAETTRDRELVVGAVAEPWAGRLRIGDRILAIDGDETARYPSRAIEKARGATVLRVDLERDGKRLAVDLEVPGDRIRIAPRGLAFSGLLVAAGGLAEIPPGQPAIHHVEDASAAESVDMRHWDWILAVAGIETPSFDVLADVVHAHRGREVEFVLRRAGSRDEWHHRAIRLTIEDVEQVGDAR